MWRRFWLRPPLFSAGRTLSAEYFSAFRLRWGAVPSFILRSLSFIYVPVDWRTSILRSCQADQQKIPKIRSIISSYATFLLFPPFSPRRKSVLRASTSRQTAATVRRNPNPTATFPQLHIPVSKFSDSRDVAVFFVYFFSRVSECQGPRITARGTRTRLRIWRRPPRRATRNGPDTRCMGWTDRRSTDACSIPWTIWATATMADWWDSLRGAGSSVRGLFSSSCSSRICDHMTEDNIVLADIFHSAYFAPVFFLFFLSLKYENSCMFQ